MPSWEKSYKADLRIKKKVHFFWVTTEDRARNNWLKKKKKEITEGDSSSVKGPLGFPSGSLVKKNNNNKIKVKVLVTQSCPTLATPKHCSPPDSLSVEFSSQEYWSGLPFLSPGDLPNPGIKPRSYCIAGRFFTIWATREDHICLPKQEILAGNMGLIPGSGRSPAEGNGNKLQYSCLGKPMGRRAWRAIVHVVPKELDTT